VNGESEIGVIKPFSEAVEMTKRILFRPFDLTKWLVIGFAAWLAHIGQGGFQFNYRYKTGDFRNTPAWRGLTDTIHRTPLWLMIVGIALAAVVIVALVVLFTWLRARGRFTFTDCIVRNRAAIAEPWREFRKLGNSFFVFSLIVGLGCLVVAIATGVPFVLLMISARAHHHHELLFLTTILSWAGLVFVLAISWSLIAHLMIPIMYRRRCLASEAFRAAVSLIANYPGEFTLYCLFWILVGIGSLVAACAVVCLTCCIAAIPYVGTVILLPLYVCLRAFGLLFLRQFGPDYDVWAVSQPPAEPLSPSAPPSVPA
jgi:hypothetical protein